MVLIMTHNVLYHFSPIVYWKLYKDKKWSYLCSNKFYLTFINNYYVAEIIIMNKIEILSHSKKGK